MQPQPCMLLKHIILTSSIWLLNQVLHPLRSIEGLPLVSCAPTLLHFRFVLQHFDFILLTSVHPALAFLILLIFFTLLTFVHFGLYFEPFSPNLIRTLASSTFALLVPHRFCSSLHPALAMNNLSVWIYLL